MPKLIVYVKADTWRRIETGYGQDAPALMRNISVEAIDGFVAGLSERAAMVSEENSERPSTALPLLPDSNHETAARSESPEYLPEREVKSDFVQKKIK